MTDLSVTGADLHVLRFWRAGGGYSEISELGVPRELGEGARVYGGGHGGSSKRLHSKYVQRCLPQLPRRSSGTGSESLGQKFSMVPFVFWDHCFESFNELALLGCIAKSIIRMLKPICHDAERFLPKYQGLNMFAEQCTCLKKVKDSTLYSYWRFVHGFRNLAYLDATAIYYLEMAGNPQRREECYCFKKKQGRCHTLGQAGAKPSERLSSLFCLGPQLTNPKHSWVMLVHRTKPCSFLTRAT